MKNGSFVLLYYITLECSAVTKTVYCLDAAVRLCFILFLYLCLLGLLWNRMGLIMSESKSEFKPGYVLELCLIKSVSFLLLPVFVSHSQFFSCLHSLFSHSLSKSHLLDIIQLHVIVMQRDHGQSEVGKVAKTCTQVTARLLCLCIHMSMSFVKIV